MSAPERDLRLAILHESDATCDECGRDPRATPATAERFLDPAGGWMTMIDDSGPDDVAHVLCPGCAGEGQGGPS